MKLPLKVRISFALKALGHVFIRPKYLLLSIFSSILMIGFILWSLNLDLLVYIIFNAPISILDKVEFFIYGYQSLFTTLDSVLSLGIIVFGILFGINLSLIVYVIRNIGYKNIPKKSGGGAFIFAILGGGCIACGTSILAPLLASLGAVGSSALMRDLGAIFNWLGSILLVYSIFKLTQLIKVKP